MPNSRAGIHLDTGGLACQEAAELGRHDCPAQIGALGSRFSHERRSPVLPAAATIPNSISKRVPSHPRTPFGHFPTHLLPWLTFDGTSSSVCSLCIRHHSNKPSALFWRIGLNLSHHLSVRLRATSSDGPKPLEMLFETDVLSSSP